MDRRIKNVRKAEFLSLVEKVGDLESRVERAYLDAYNLLMSRNLERYGLMGVDEIKVAGGNSLANDPKGPLLIPREVIEKRADLELFIAQELLRNALFKLMKLIFSVS